MKYYVCLTPFFPSEGHFVGPYILDQMKSIAKNSDYQVIVMKPTLFYKQESDYEYDGVKVYRFKDYTLPSNIYPNGLSDWLSYKSFRNKLKRLGIEPSDIAVCHVHVAHMGSKAVRLKRDFPSVKVIVQHHGFDVMSVSDGRLANFKWHERRCIRYGVRICNEADLNVGVSHKTLEYVQQQPGINFKDSYILYNGVDTSLFNPGNPRKTNDHFTIGCVANFWALKDQLTLIKAVHRLINDGITKIKVIFVGSGYTKESCERYVSDNGLTKYFEFRKEVMHDELPDFYRTLNLFVLPSFWEAFGCVYTEAYACGVPFIGVKGQGIAELVPPESQNKWLINKSDDLMLSELILRQIENPNRTQELSSSVDIDNLINNYLEYLKRY